MATGTPKPPPPPMPPASGPPAEASSSEQVIQERLEQARWQIRVLDLIAGLVTVGALVLVCLLGLIVLDHWLVPGGLGFWGRLLAMLALLGIGGYTFARVVWPSVRYAVNPLYAASVIERSRPTLKNSLINLLLLRGDRRRVRPVIFNAIEQRAAVDLSEVELEAAIDRGRMFRLSYIFLGALAVFALYLVLSPKSPLASTARVLWPWADIAPPTRVTITDIEPGNATAYFGDRVEVIARVDGLRADEPVQLVYSTADGQLVDQVVPMTRPEDGYRYRAELPPGTRGLQQDHVYRIVAGDAETRPMRVTVEIPPTLLVDRVVLDYPDYTGLERRAQVNQGDIRALEGTRVTVEADANVAIRRASIDLGCQGTTNLPMNVDDRRATGQFMLRTRPDAPGQPLHDCYQLRVVDRQGRGNPRPIRHRIEVIPDLPPEVRLVRPEAKRVELPADDTLTIGVEAEDPDFGLRRVAVRAIHDGDPLGLTPLLSRRSDEAHEGVFRAEMTFTPAEHDLKPGDRVLYWAEADDNRQPDPGRTATERRWIEIVAPIGADERGPDGQAAERQPDAASEPGEPDNADPMPPEDQLAGDAANPDAAAEPNQPAAPDEPPSGEGEQGDPSDSSDAGEGGQSSDQAGEQGEPGEDQQGQGEQQGGQQDAPPTPVDPDTNPGDAFERILEHRQQEQQQEQQPSGQQSDQPSDQQQPGQSAQQQPPGEGQSPPAGDPSPSDAQPQEQGDRPQPDQQQQGNQPQPGGQPSESGQRGEQNQGGGPSDQGQEPPPSDPNQPGQSGAQGDQHGPGQPDPSGATPGGAPEQPGQRTAPDPSQPDTTPGGQGGQRTGEPGSGEGPTQSGETDVGPSEQQPTGGQPTGQPSEQMPPEPRPGGQDAGGQQGERIPRQTPGAGRGSQQNQGSPAPQEDNADRGKQPGAEPGQATPEQQPAQSPTTSKRQSDSQGESSGDRSGGGEEGGGQRSPRQGQGTPGSQTPSDAGNPGGAEPGAGQTGPRAGDRVSTDEQTGQSVRRPGEGSSGRGDGSSGREGRPLHSQRAAADDGQAPEDAQPSENGDPNTPGGQPSERQQQQQPAGGAGQRGRGAEGPGQSATATPSEQRPTGGGQPGQGPSARQSGDSQPGAMDPTTDYARRQTQLALEHLEDQLESGDRDLLEQLGWKPDEAQRFLQRWKDLQRAADRQGPAGDEARRSLDKALRSLGLRPQGTQLDRGTTPLERLESLRESGRLKPPADWADQFEAYTRGIAEGESAPATSGSR